MFLFIDSSNLEEVKLALVGSKQIKFHNFQLENNLSEKLIPEIKKFLAKQKIKLADLKKLAVVVGPGPFSRVRTAVATANSLGLALGIKIIALKSSEPMDLTKVANLAGSIQVRPFYDRAPNITKPQGKFK